MTKDFRFGLEAEFFLADSRDWKALWHKDYTFKQMDQMFQQISLEGIPSLDGLAAEPPHEKLMPFIVEGYGMPDENFKTVDALPKGIEIRTPVCDSLSQLKEVYGILFDRVSKKLGEQNFAPVALSHHPVETKFSGPQNKRRHDYWQWAMEVMTTYGPDINVSFPKEISDRLFSDLEDLEAKVNYYAPGMASLTLASPFFDGKPWRHKNQLGRAYRTFRRSVIAPAIELHADENFRIEFKVFEMANSWQDFHNNFLLTLALFLDDGLRGRASKQERIYDLGQVSFMGLHYEEGRRPLGELLERAPKVLQSFGFKSETLESYFERFESRLTPADLILEEYHRLESSVGRTEALAQIYRQRSVLIP